MEASEPELQDAMQRYAARNRLGLTAGPPGPLNVIATVALLLVQAGLLYASMMLSLVFGMSTDSCAYQACGDESWIERAIIVTLPGSGVVFLAAAIIAVSRLAQRKRAFFVPLLGAIVQLLLMVIGWVMAM